MTGLAARIAHRMALGLWLLACASGAAKAEIAPPAAVIGERTILVIAVRFPDADPRVSRPQIEKKISNVGSYLRLASYGKVWLTPRLTEWHALPAPLAEYKVSPFNYRVDRQRVRRLLADALSAARAEVDPAGFDVIWLLLGAETRPGEGYGMIAYAANPGMLSGVREARTQLEAIPLAGGGEFRGPVIVSAENAHIGHVAHDLLHALGGARDGHRAVPDLYDFDLQSNPPAGRLSPELIAVHAGPWDIMSQHFIEWRKPPPQPSSFTRLQLGWITPEQVITLTPGETREIALAPLASGQGPLVVRVPLAPGRYLLIENRQPISGDAILPASGMLVMEIDETRREGAGIVKVADANPGVRYLYAAPYLPGSGPYYINRDAGVAAAPLRIEPGGRLHLIVSTPDGIRQRIGGKR